jgi:hypothetical protein
MKTEEDITIRRYCGDINDRLLACRNKTIAVALKERLCAELKTHCISSMINNVLQEHIDQLISEIFDHDGKNKFLETL